MNIIFRVDASIQIGTGHVMRCLTLADTLKQQGAGCYFICREHPGNLIAGIKQRGHHVYALPYTEQVQNNKQINTESELDHAAWLGATQEEDANLCIALIEPLQPDWLIVDHYAIDKRWESKLRPYCKHIMVIDDLADRHHDCDLLLDQTFGRDSEDYKPLVPDHCELLCGAQYALLRPEFAEWRDYSLKRRANGQIEHLLINLGGVDKDNITTQILKSLTTSALPERSRITVVMGATAPWIAAVKQQAKIMPWQTDVKVGVNNMAELMTNSDLAIGAAGATSWERCCLGLPTIMVVLADNQIGAAKALSDVNAAVSLPYSNNFEVLLVSAVNQAIAHPRSTLEIGKAAKAITDGLGAKKIVLSIATLKRKTK